VNRVLAVAVAVLLVVGAIAAAWPGVHHARQDLAAIRHDTDQQLLGVRRQVATAREQLAIMRRQLEVAEDQRGLSEETRDIAAQ
jgi:hypothetical protein